MTPYPELRRLARELEANTPSEKLEMRARYSLFTSRILRNIPEARPSRRFLVLIARAYRSLLRERAK